MEEEMRESKESVRDERKRECIEMSRKPAKGIGKIIRRN